jgi:hypothetical protein
MRTDYLNGVDGLVFDEMSSALGRSHSWSDEATADSFLPRDCPAATKEAAWTRSGAAAGSVEIDLLAGR